MQETRVKGDQCCFIALGSRAQEKIRFQDYLKSGTLDKDVTINLSIIEDNF